MATLRRQILGHILGFIPSFLILEFVYGYLEGVLAHGLA